MRENKHVGNFQPGWDITMRHTQGTSALGYSISTQGTSALGYYISTLRVVKLSKHNEQRIQLWKLMCKE